jgi:4-hydroxyphenylpyruvate dioxygenase
MTSHTDKGPKPEIGTYEGFDHIHWWVGNAKMTASWFCARLGFKPVAYSGLETGNRKYASHAIQQGKVRFVFSSPLNPEETVVMGEDMGRHQAMHGDGVKDVAFAVDDVVGVYTEAVKRGAESVREPETVTDEFGTIVMATIKTYGNTVHSFVQRGEYSGFLPTYVPVTKTDPLTDITPSPALDFVDHVVGNMPDAGMAPTVEFYEKILQFHRFWTVDDSQIHTKYSALRSTVMADYDEVVKMPINEPADGLKKSQIQEYVEYYGGAGVQHIALNTRDIINAVTQMRARGVEFLKVPETYYSLLAERLAGSSIEVKEDLELLKSLDILVDFDDKGYLLQLFTRPLMDRPTVFLEIIQREGNSGFGAGNFQSLFESIEREQAARGNL